MLPNLLVRTAIVTATAASLAAFVPAPAVAESVEGTITHVELHDTPRHIMVRTGGEEVQVRISNRTQVDFGAADQGYFTEELSSLKAGMQVRVNYDADQPARLVSVLNVPSDERRAAVERFERDRDTVRDGDEMKVRLTEVDRRRGTFRADFRGSERSFVADDPKLLASYRVGDLVFVKVQANNEVTNIRTASLTGRIVDLDLTAGRLVVDIDGREATYKMDRVNILSRRLAEGDTIRFDVEEHSDGDRMIDVHKLSGSR